MLCALRAIRVGASTIGRSMTGAGFGAAAAAARKLATSLAVDLRAARRGLAAAGGFGGGVAAARKGSIGFAPATLAAFAVFASELSSPARASTVRRCP
jgi:hypothetical protein